MQTDPFALPAFILAIISLVVATIGALTGVVALVWQIITRTRGAHRVTVSVANSVLIGDGMPDGVFISVEAINKGASAVRIINWGFQLPSGEGITVYVPVPLSTTLPHMLEPGTNATFFVPAANLGGAIRTRDGLTPRDLRAVVGLATGEKIFAKLGSLKLAEEFWR
ncbi:hypothetical protein [Microbacterium immunditiarum]|uniref:Uncharacterized protein n=1 Tax=Microbacterium immunditiarum TaxID=337480 RepID=A0A7Y9GQD2_9MICO|nr:hypothetical protein [Microbacterium immunditiarum]NYE19610.1 hypothetical protein [Microbacterium immunditiarum]